MIKYKKSESGLRDYPIRFRDVSDYSHNYFKITDFPDTFYVGKNIFRILGDADKLVPKSKVFIDIIDAAGNPIYYEIVPVITQEKNKIVSVVVYSDTPPGKATIYVGGRLSVDPKTNTSIPYSSDASSPNYLHIPNLIWSREINIVTTKSNSSQVFFPSDPIVSYRKRSEKYRTLSDASRTINVSSSGNFSIESGLTPSVHGGIGVVKESTNILQKNNVEDGDGFSTVNRSRLPDYLNLTTLYSDTFEFNERMVGGVITLNAIDITQLLPPSVRESASKLSGFVYSASVVSVINKNTITLDNPFSLNTEYIQPNGLRGVYSVTNLINHNNFTCSYYSEPVYAETPTTASFITFEIHNMEPAGGVVKKLGIRYKVANTIGDYVNLGEYDVVERNLLIDPANILISPTEGIIERPIGKFTQNILSTYWSASCVDNTRTPTASLSPSIENSVRLTYTGDDSQVNSPIIFEVLPEYGMQSYGNTEYKLSFNTHLSSGTFGNSHQMDVYISGSQITTDTLPKINYNPLVNRGLGTYIGSVTSNSDVSSKISMYFKTVGSGKIVPKFVIRKGHYDISNVEICPRTDIGFSPNHYRLNVRANDFDVGDLLIDIVYKNDNTTTSNAVSRIDKLNISELDKDYNLKIGSLTITYRGSLQAQPGQMRYLGSINVPVSCSIENFYTIISGSNLIDDTSFDVTRTVVGGFVPTYSPSSSIIPNGAVKMSVRYSASYGSAEFETSDWLTVGKGRPEILNFYASSSGWIPDRETMTSMIMVLRKL